MILFKLRARILLALFSLLVCAAVNQDISAQEPGWYPYTFARGLDRVVISQTPIELRPYRPFHFYGNSQRRSYYRGNPFPQLRDYQQTTRNLFYRNELARRTRLPIIVE